MTSQLKIHCLLKTTAKKFKAEGRRGGERKRKKKSCFETRGGGVCDRKSELVTEDVRVVSKVL